MTRFLRNRAVTVDEMLSTAARQTAVRCAGRRVLAIQDTTLVGEDAHGASLYLHAVLAVDEADGAILGLLHGEFLLRSQGRRASRRSRPVADKESRRWSTGAQRAADLCAEAAGVTVIADRESDIYATFARRPAAVDLVVRAAHDRALETDGARLFAHVDALAEAGRTELDLPAKPGRPARTARLVVRHGAVALARPRNGLCEGLPDSVSLFVVDLREIDPPAGVPALHWRLFTTRRVEDLAQALAVADLYRRRWAIEQLFRTLKTQGFDIEGLRISEEEPRSKLTIAAVLAAVTVQQLVHARDGAADLAPLRPLTDAFEPGDQALLEALCTSIEGKTARQKNPHPKGSLAYAAWVCARLGGWTGYYGKPGPVVMLLGWKQFQAAKLACAALARPPNV